MAYFSQQSAALQQLCAGASQIALMAEEKSHSRFLFAPSLTLRNGGYHEKFRRFKAHAARGGP